MNVVTIPTNVPVQRVDATITPNGTVVTQTAQSFGPEGAPLREQADSAQQRLSRRRDARARLSELLRLCQRSPSDTLAILASGAAGNANIAGAGAAKVTVTDPSCRATAVIVGWPGTAASGHTAGPGAAVGQGPAGEDRRQNSRQIRRQIRRRGRAARGRWRRACSSAPVRVRCRLP